MGNYNIKSYAGVSIEGKELRLGMSKSEIKKITMNTVLIYK